MPPKRATPGQGAERRYEQFSYTKTGPGLKNQWPCWCSCEPYWCKVHEHTEKTPGTKVCVDWFTDGALICPRCRPAHEPTTIAYVAVWRAEDLKPCMVICHESVSDMLMLLKFGVEATVGCTDRNSSVWVRATGIQSKWVSALPYRQKAIDIMVSLLTMWGYPALTSWYANDAKSRGSGAGVAVKPDGTPFDPMHQAAARRAGATVSEEPLTVEAYEAMKRSFAADLGAATMPSKNGHHKKGS